MRRGSGQHLHPAHLRFLRKMDRETRIHTEGIKTDTKLEKWFDNFWYHHKWVTVGVAFALLVVIICTVQMCGKEKNDLTVVYAGRNQLSPAESQNFSQVLESICPEDFDKNGENDTALSYTLLSDAVYAYGHYCARIQKKQSSACNERAYAHITNEQKIP